MSVTLHVPKSNWSPTIKDQQPSIRPVSSYLSAPCALNILPKALIHTHTLTFHVHTRVLNVLHLVSVYLDAPGCPTNPPAIFLLSFLLLLAASSE